MNYMDGENFSANEPRFHIGDDGDPRPCTAPEYECPKYPGQPHFNDKDKAREYYAASKDPIAPSMKKISWKELRRQILNESQLSAADKALLDSSINLATYLHSDQRRKAVINGRRNTPYIEHPLRNTLRLIRLGVRDKDVLISAVLHDTVEDCAQIFVKDYLNDSTPYTEAEARAVLVNHIEEKYGPDVRRITLGVTLPPVGANEHRVQRTEQEKREAYRDTVVEEISTDPQVFLVKLTDIFDNAGSLHHAQPDELKGAVRRARKYILVVPTLKEKLTEFKGQLGVDERGYSHMQFKLKNLEARLHKLIADDDAKNAL